MKLFTVLQFSVVVVALYFQVEVLGSPSPRIERGNYNYSVSKPIAPWPAQGKNTFTGEHGSNVKNISDLYSTAILCTRSFGHAYDISYRNCSRTGTQAHCGRNMIFYRYSDLFGSCDCNSASNVPLFRIDNIQNATSRCYYLYTQAQCDSGNWLEPDVQGVVRCSPNRCYSSGQFSPSFGKLSLAYRIPEYVPLNSNGTCTKLFGPSKFCKPNEVVTFVGNNKYASCSRDFIRLPCFT